MSFTPNYLNFQFDQFNGVTVQSCENKQACMDFKQELIQLVALAKSEKKQLIWLTLPRTHAAYIPMATQLDFQFHNCLENEITLTLALKEAAYIPFVPSYTIGAGAIVTNQAGEILVINERISRSQAYKLPGGHVEMTEKIADAIVREVFEETGVQCEFDSILGLTTKHPYRFGKSNMYFICKLNALSQEINIQDTHEIQDAKWVKITDYIEDKSHALLNRTMVKALHDKQGLALFDTDHIPSSQPKLETFFSKA